MIMSVSYNWGQRSDVCRSQTEVPVIHIGGYAPKNQKIQTSISEGTKANCFYMTVQKMYFKKPE